MFHSKARWDFHSSKKKGEKEKRKKIHSYSIFFRTSWWAGQTLHVPGVFPRQLAFTCTLRLKTHVKVSLYIYIYLYIFICIYIYIYKKDKEAEGPSGFSCCGQVMLPRCCAEDASRPVGDQLTTLSCHTVLLLGQGRAPATLCPSLGALVVPQTSCTARDCDHEPLGTPGREGGGGRWRKERPSP